MYFKENIVYNKVHITLTMFDGIVLRVIFSMVQWEVMDTPSLYCIIFTVCLTFGFFCLFTADFYAFLTNICFKYFYHFNIDMRPNSSSGPFMFMLVI